MRNATRGCLSLLVWALLGVACAPSASSTAEIVTEAKCDREKLKQWDKANPEKGPGSGGLSPREITHVIKSNMNDVDRCYESALARQADLKGKITVLFIVGKSGKVTYHCLDAVSLNRRDEDLERCVDSSVKTWIFPKPSDKEVRVRYPFEFQPKPRANVAVTSADKVKVQGGLTKRQFLGTIEANLQTIRTGCYEPELVKNPKAHGTVELRFQISPSGKASVTATKNGTKSAALKTCVVDLANTWKFQEAADGKSTTVSYSFTFSTL